jgi:hypothetical protein
LNISFTEPPPPSIHKLLSQCELADQNLRAFADALSALDATAQRIAGITGGFPSAEQTRSWARRAHVTGLIKHQRWMDLPVLPPSERHDFITGGKAWCSRIDSWADQILGTDKLGEAAE